MISPGSLTSQFEAGVFEQLGFVEHNLYLVDYTLKLVQLACVKCLRWWVEVDIPSALVTNRTTWDEDAFRFACRFLESALRKQDKSWS
jgi:hypothetical protein